ncbi:Tctex1d4 [Columba livia]|nr:Tctex1d4 [Columba livia]
MAALAEPQLAKAAGERQRQLLQSLQDLCIQPCRDAYARRMRPDEGCKFDAGRVQQVLDTVLASTLGTTVYSPQGSARLAQSLAELLRGRVKEVAPPRYKLVCQVLLGQRGQQSLLVASRALWDPESDNFASTTFSNTSLFAVATVHGVYLE